MALIIPGLFNEHCMLQLKNSFLFTLPALLFSLMSAAQKNERNGSLSASNIFIELGGNSGIISLNYDQRFTKTNSGLGGRIGVGVGGVPGHLFPGTILTVPVAINYLMGQGPHHFEGGAGVTIGEEEFSATGSSRIASVFFVPSVGYRYQPLHRRITVRVVASPFIANKTQFWAGLSFGIRF